MSANMVQVERDDFGALLDSTVVACEAIDSLEDIDATITERLGEELALISRLASVVRLVRISHVVRQLQRLLAVVDAEGSYLRDSATIRRGLDMLSLLAQDSERQRRGLPAAALDEALDAFVDQVERALRGERGARIMRFPQSRTYPGASDARAPWPSPPGTT